MLACGYLTTLSSYIAAYAAAAFSSLILADLPGDCKIRPTDSAWPPLLQWRVLNSSVSGRLIQSSAPGFVCRQTSPLYSNASCSTTRESWSDPDWHALDAASVDYNDDSCPVDQLNTTCSDAGYPAYVVNATEACHIQAAVNFAREHGVRLIVKATGHDVPGRSSGAGSLSVWTHYVQGMSVNHGDPVAVKYGGVASATIAAGMRWGEIYSRAAVENITLMGGSDATVGVVGWALGAGHGPLTAKFGLGADQILSMDVVTADGELRTVNETATPDLFWALRGGGASTFGAVVSITFKAYPAVTMTAYGFAYNTTANSETFWEMLAYFHTHVPDLMDAGLMGYYFPTPFVANNTGQGQLAGIFFAPGMSQDRVEQLLMPLESGLRSSSWPDKIAVGGSYHPNWTLEDFEASSPPESVGNGLRLGSRLMDRHALTANVSHAAALLKRSVQIPTGISAQPYSSLIGHMVAGPGPRDVTIPGGSDAVLPAWRKAYVHLVISLPLADVGLAPDNATEARTTAALRDVQVPALVDLAPHTGAYMSEADPTTVEWRKTFYGRHYPRLFALKQKWDPQGVFWCVPCVGHELWSVTGGSAIGQGRGRICRRSKA